jgi:hypothetical protein
MLVRSQQQVEQGAKRTAKWSSEYGVTLTAMAEFIAEDKIEQCVALQQSDGWFVVIIKLRRERVVRHLATFRVLAKPRRFRRLDVMFKVLVKDLGYSGPLQVLQYVRGSGRRLDKI